MTMHLSTLGFIPVDPTDTEGAFEKHNNLSGRPYLIIMPEFKQEKGTWVIPDNFVLTAFAKGISPLMFMELVDGLNNIAKEIVDDDNVCPLHWQHDGEGNGLD